MHGILYNPISQFFLIFDLFMRFVGLSKKKMHKRLVAGNSSGRAAVQPCRRHRNRSFAIKAGRAAHHSPTFNVINKISGAVSG